MTKQTNTLHLGPYRVTFQSEDLPLPEGKCVVMDTRTGEGGTFDEDATIAAITDALDTFFIEQF